MKSRKDHRQSFRLTRNGFSIRVEWTTVSGKGGRGAGALVAPTAIEPSSVTIIREPDGHYYASFVIDVETSPLPFGRPAGRRRCGPHRLATVAASDGQRTDIANPKHLGRKLHKLRRLEREKSRRQKGSANRDKSRKRSQSHTTM